MSTWVQPYETPGSRIVLTNAQVIDEDWERDTARTHFEGRRYPVTARTERTTQAWTLATTWSADTRAQAEAYLDLLRTVALDGTDTRLDLHVEPANGLPIDAVVQATDVPQDLDPGKTEIAVTYRRVA